MQSVHFQLPEFKFFPSPRIRYEFDDGTIISETGFFKLIDEVVRVFGEGFYQFRVQKQIYKLYFDIAEDGSRAELSKSNW